MKKISLKICLTVCLCLILCSSNAFTAEKLRIYADPNSRETYSCSGVMLDHASDGGQMLVSYPDNLGTGSCAGLLGESNIMWAFRLPALPPGTKYGLFSGGTHGPAGDAPHS
jgi:hypothetical protein